MKDDEVVAIIAEHLKAQFPRHCSTCNKRYETMAQLIRETTRRGEPVSYDVEIGDERPTEPLGSMALVNCECGSTLSLSSAGMPLATLWRLMRWALTKRSRTGRTVSNILAEVRDLVDAQVLAEE